MAGAAAGGGEGGAGAERSNAAALWHALFAERKSIRYPIWIGIMLPLLSMAKPVAQRPMRRMQRNTSSAGADPP